MFDLIGGPDRAEVCGTLQWDGPDSIAEIEDWIQRTNTMTFGDYGFHWTIRDRDGVFTGEKGRPLGNIGTRPRGEPGRVDVGYWLGRPYWGRGIMGEALERLLELCFSDFDCYKVEADVYTHNARGLRLVESAGMTREGVIRNAYRKEGRFVDATLYGILKSEWMTSSDRRG